MEKSNRIGLIIILTVFLIIGFSTTNMNFVASEKTNIENNYPIAKEEMLVSYTDITPDEAWDFLSDQSNGIQIPIDVRTDSEYRSEHIDTPFPEHPRHHNVNEWDVEVIDEIKAMYQGETVIVYCKSGGRSSSAASMLVNYGFEGTIYNMLGGITSWKSNGHPTVPNRAPETPTIIGPDFGSPDETYEFTISSNDADYNDIYYTVDWDDSTTESIGPFESGEEITLSKQWSERGIYQISVKAEDRYNAESETATFEISISSTELDIINLNSVLGGVSVDIKNIGLETADEINAIIQVKGGIFSYINLSYQLSQSNPSDLSLEPDNTMTLSTRLSGFLFGIGDLEITISAWAKNAAIVEKQLTGRIIGPFILLD